MVAEQTHTERMDQDNEVQVLFTELLESLSQSTNQLQQNLEAQQVCFATRRLSKMTPDQRLDALCRSEPVTINVPSSWKSGTIDKSSTRLRIAS